MRLLPQAARSAGPIQPMSLAALAMGAAVIFLPDLKLHEPQVESAKTRLVLCRGLFGPQSADAAHGRGNAPRLSRFHRTLSIAKASRRLSRQLFFGDEEVPRLATQRGLKRLEASKTNLPCPLGRQRALRRWKRTSAIAKSLAHGLYGHAGERPSTDGSRDGCWQVASNASVTTFSKQAM